MIQISSTDHRVELYMQYMYMQTERSQKHPYTRKSDIKVLRRQCDRSSSHRQIEHSGCAPTLEDIMCGRTGTKLDTKATQQTGTINFNWHIHGRNLREIVQSEKEETESAMSVCSGACVARVQTI